MTDEERRGSILPKTLASDLDKQGRTDELRSLVHARICKGLCMECGTKSANEFCAECLRAFPITHNVGEPVDGWQYRVVQSKPEFAGSLRVERADAFPPERKGAVQFIACVDSLAAGVAMCERKIARHMREVW